MLKYPTRTEAINIDSKVVNHDAWSSVGILDGAGLSRCELFKTQAVDYIA